MNNKDFHKVLMVDDDVFFIELHKLMLQWSNLDDFLIGMDSAFDALNFCNKAKLDNSSIPKYILLDLNMPGMNGFEFMRQFEKYYSNIFPETEIIVVTSSSRVKDRLNSIEFPFVKDYVIKPLPEKYIENLIVPINDK